MLILDAMHMIRGVCAAFHPYIQIAALHERGMGCTCTIYCRINVVGWCCCVCVCEYGHAGEHDCVDTGE